MILAAPLADELASGHIGRLRALSRQKTNTDCIGLLRRHYAKRELGALNDPVAHVVAALCKIPTDTYLRLHTMLPFTAFATLEKLRTPNGSWVGTVVTRSGLLTPRQGAYACPACIAEDRHFRGFSYWRRLHQLPSELWCAKHPTVVLVHVDHPRPFDRLPEAWLGSEHAKPLQLTESIRASEFRLAFEDACQAMLEYGQSLPGERVRRAIADAASAAGLRTRAAGFGPVLSDRVIERAPSDLVGQIYPELVAKTRGAYINSIDEATRCRPSAPLATGTATAIAMIFSSAKDALLIFQGRLPGPVPGKKKTITDLFLAHKGALPAIARALGVSEEEARRRTWECRKADKTSLTAARGALVRYIDGVSLIDACKEHCADIDLVENLIRARLHRRKSPITTTAPISGRA